MKVEFTEPVILSKEDIDALQEDMLRSAREAGHVLDPKFVFNPPKLVAKDGERI